MGWFTTFFYSQLFVTPKYPDHDFSEQTIVVTGSNIGLGFEAARHLARLNAAKVIIACRTLSKGEKAKEEILQSTKRKDDCIEVWKLDLSDYESVKAFAKRAEGLERLDAVIESAGVNNEDWVFDGGEEQIIKVNVVSTLLLALLLLPKLRETSSKFSKKAKLEIVTSEMHAFSKLKEANDDDLYGTLAKAADERSGSIFERYPMSKLMEILFVQELVKHTKDTPVITLANPGFCWSNLVRLDSAVKLFVINVLRKLLARTTEVGSRNLVAGIVAGPESHGHYMSDGINQDHGLAPWISTSEGQKKQKRLYDQTLALLEKISPGISKNV